jgi:histidinol dehydrogenase
MIDEHMLGLYSLFIFQNRSDDGRALVLVMQVGRVDQNHLSVFGSYLDLFLEDRDFIRRILIQSDFTNTKNARMMQQGRNQLDHLPRQLHVFRFLGIDANPAVMIDPILGGSERFHLREKPKVIGEAGSRRTIITRPEGGFTDRDDAAASHVLIIVSRSADAVNVGIDELHADLSLKMVCTFSARATPGVSNTAIASRSSRNRVSDFASSAPPADRSMRSKSAASDKHRHRISKNCRFRVSIALDIPGFYRSKQAASLISRRLPAKNRVFAGLFGSPLALPLPFQAMIPILHPSIMSERQRIESLLSELRLDPTELTSADGRYATENRVVQEIIRDVSARRDDAIVDNARKFDFPEFTREMIRVSQTEMDEAAQRVTPDQLKALRRSIAQVREYQLHILPKDPPPLRRAGVELGLHFTPLDSAGLYFPGGKAAYPSSLIMLAVPAQAAGVKRIVVCTPPSKYGRSDLVLAACHELKLEHVFRAGGATAIAAMAFGTETIPAVDKILGPGNLYVQLAKRTVAGAVGVDGFLGPSEILILADETGVPDFIAADLIAQAEHDPGSCFLLTTSKSLATAVCAEIERQLKSRQRADAIERALVSHSAIVVAPSMDALIELANRFAAEHVNLQVKDEAAVLKRLRHAGAVFIGPYSPVAAGDYVAGPSHCLPTNTTARFSSGVSVYEFLKRSSVVKYDAKGLATDSASIVTLANAEHLDGHAASIQVRTQVRG